MRVVSLLGLSALLLFSLASIVFRGDAYNELFQQSLSDSGARLSGWESPAGGSSPYNSEARQYGSDPSPARLAGFTTSAQRSRPEGSYTNYGPARLAGWSQVRRRMGRNGLRQRSQLTAQLGDRSPSRSARNILEKFKDYKLDSAMKNLMYSEHSGSLVLNELAKIPRKGLSASDFYPSA